MRESERIPATKVQRSVKIVNTGLKVGLNHLKYYSKRVVQPGLAREVLDQANAEDIYNSLSELKGSALKVAQMLSLDKNVLPPAYAEKFALSQHRAPPLSAPLIVRTFIRYFGKPPHEIFDQFEVRSRHAASIGQVHRAKLGNLNLAVKIQYPGVAESISSDLRLVRPFALRLFRLEGRDLDNYMREVEERVLEETDYRLELERSVQFGRACGALPDLVFPKYYPEHSNHRVITMDWLEGLHLSDFLATNPSQAERDRVGQALWDFYNFQQHQLKAVHADPHPGNFLIMPDGRVGILDFGCVKEIPEDFYQAFFSLTQRSFSDDESRMLRVFQTLEMILPGDSPERIDLYFRIFRESIELFAAPYLDTFFDFGNDDYFTSLYAFGDRVTAMPEFRQARGSKHFIYVNRTNFGLYNILHTLGARVRTDTWTPGLLEQLT